MLAAQAMLNLDAEGYWTGSRHGRRAGRTGLGSPKDARQLLCERATASARIASSTSRMLAFSCTHTACNHACSPALHLHDGRQKKTENMVRLPVTLLLCPHLQSIMPMHGASATLNPKHIWRAPGRAHPPAHFIAYHQAQCSWPAPACASACARAGTRHGVPAGQAASVLNPLP